MFSIRKRIILVEVLIPLEDFLTLAPAGGLQLMFSIRKRIIFVDVLLLLKDFLTLAAAGGLQLNVF